LLDLINLPHPLVVLDIHSWVASPRSLVYPVATTRLPSLTEIMVTDFAEIGKAHPGWIATDSIKYFIQRGHIKVVSIMISKVKRIIPDRD
jgi:hypothetical protein